MNKTLLKLGLDEMQPHHELSLNQPLLNKHHSFLPDYHLGAIAKTWLFGIVFLIVMTVGCSAYEDYLMRGFDPPLSKQTLSYDRHIYNKLYPKPRNQYPVIMNPYQLHHSYMNDLNIIKKSDLEQRNRKRKISKARHPVTYTNSSPQYSISPNATGTTGYYPSQQNDNFVQNPNLNGNNP